MAVTSLYIEVQEIGPVLTVKALAACSVSLIIFRLLCQQDGAAEKPCSSCNAKGCSSAK